MKKLCIISIISLLPFILLTSCGKKEDSINQLLPEVETGAITNMQSTSATLTGNAVFDKGFEITEKGFVWGTSPNPTENTTINGSGTGFFNHSLKNLERGTEYYIKAYATSSQGTAYGEILSFKLGTVKDIEGNEYSTITLDGTTWMTANLKVTKYTNGDPIPLVNSDMDWSDLKTGARSNVDGKTSNTNSYGMLYNWMAATDTRGICPEGWSVPSFDDYNNLYRYASDNGGTGALKSTGTTFWKSPNEKATNTLEFNGVGSGTRNADGTYSLFQEEVRYWTNKNAATTLTKAYGFWQKYDDNGFYYWTYPIEDGNCIRCMQDK